MCLPMTCRTTVVGLVSFGSLCPCVLLLTVFLRNATSASCVFARGSCNPSEIDITVKVYAKFPF